MTERQRITITEVSSCGHGIYRTIASADIEADRLEAEGYEVECGWDSQFDLPAIRWRSKPSASVAEGRVGA